MSEFAFASKVEPLRGRYVDLEPYSEELKTDLQRALN